MSEENVHFRRNISEIKNKQRREQARRKLVEEKNKEKKKRKLQLAKENGGEVPKQVPKTIESMRVFDETKILESDDELNEEFNEENEEVSPETAVLEQPKILITTTDRPNSRTNKFCKELKKSLPNSKIYYRRGLNLKDITVQAINKGYTGLVVINEDSKTPNGVIISRLPEGPTATFRLSNVVFAKEIKRHGEMTDHIPELIFNNFTTTIGKTVQQLIASLYPKFSDYNGRKTITFHNQRDYIFFRQHRYQFKQKNDTQKAGLQELGPRFTLKLRSLQHGTFNSKFGEYEFIRKREKSRRKFVM